LHSIEKPSGSPDGFLFQRAVAISNTFYKSGQPGTDANARHGVTRSRFRPSSEVHGRCSGDRNGYKRRFANGVL